MTVVEAAGIGPVTVGARLYRWRGERMLAVVVKAAYELRHGAPMTVMPPTMWRTRGNVAHPGDEPFPLRQAEIVVGPLPQVARAPGATVGLTVRRGDRTLLDVRRTAGDDGARDATVGFGPVPPASPARAALAAELDPASLPGAAELSLDDHLDAAFFQAAPAAQRLDDLRPGDELILTGMSPVARVLHTTIPAQRAAAVVQMGGEPPRRFALRLDRIHVAPDALVAELSYRFAVPVADGVQAIRVAGGLDSASSPFGAPAIGSMPMTPVSVLADAPPTALREERPPPTEILGGPSTAPLAPHGGTVLMSSPVAPMSAAAAARTSPQGPTEARGAVPSSPFESTVVVSPDAAAPSSLPFHRMPASSPHAAPSAPIPGAPWTGTAPARVVPASVPSPGGDDAPPRTVLLGQTMASSMVDLELDLDVPPSVRAADLTPTVEEAPAPPVAGGAPGAGPAPPAVPAPAAPEGSAAAAPSAAARPKADPWRKDGDLPAAQAPPPAPPAAPRAGPTRPDLSSGLYKRFKR